MSIPRHRSDEQLVEAAKKLFDAIGAQEPAHNIKWEIGLAVSQWLEDYEASREPKQPQQEVPAQPQQLVIREDAKAIAKEAEHLAFNPDDYPCPVCGETRCPGLFNPLACVNKSPAPLGVICQVVGCKGSNAVHCSKCSAWLCAYHFPLRFHNFDLKRQVGSMYAEPNHLPIWAE